MSSIGNTTCHRRTYREVLELKVVAIVGTMEAGHRRAEVPTYKSWSVFTALCCCLPLGIFAYMASNKAEGANRAGDVATATEASRQAKTLNVFGLVCGIVSVIAFSIVYSFLMQQELKKLH